MSGLRKSPLFTPELSSRFGYCFWFEFVIYVGIFPLGSSAGSVDFLFFRILLLVPTGPYELFMARWLGKDADTLWLSMALLAVFMLANVCGEPIDIGLRFLAPGSGAYKFPKFLALA